ncbi:MAG: dynamin family protein [Syntrophales bacterium]
MDIATYEKRRDELTGLLAEAIDLPQLPDGEKTTLNKIRKRINENEFSIVLIGGFQSGKTTTFNTLCGGRELNAMGFGIKTSGCVVAAQHIFEESEKERAEVTWRTQEEIIAGFSKRLQIELREMKNGNIEMPLHSYFFLDNQEDRELLKNTAAKLWMERRELKHDQEDTDKDILCIALLVSQFYGKPELQKWQEKKVYPLEKLRGLARFPERWSDRWGQDIAVGVSKFTLEEVLFAFISEVRIFIHAKDGLGRMGCVLIDSPGLFASEWDQKVANRAMKEANAIFYLVDGFKTITKVDYDVLKKLAVDVRQDLRNKVFLGFNARMPEADAHRCLEASLHILAEDGLVLDAASTEVYHAPLALRAVQIAAYLDGKINPDSDMVISEEEKPEAYLFDKLIEYAATLKGFSKAKTLIFSKDGARQALEWSSLSTLIEKGQQFVIRNKWRSILIDGGAERIKAILEMVEGSLHNREKTARETEDKFREKLKIADVALTKFEEECLGFISDTGGLDDTAPDVVLADDFKSRCRDGAHLLATTIGGRWYEDIKLWLVIKAAFSKKSKEEKKKMVEAIYREELERHVRNQFETWSSEIYAGNNDLYNQQIAERIQKIAAKAEASWNKVVALKLDMLVNINTTWPSGDLTLDDELFKNHDWEGISTGDKFLFKAGNYIGYATGIAALIYAIFGGPLVGWVAITAALVAAVVALALGESVIKPGAEDWIKKKWGDKAKPFVNDALAAANGPESIGKNMIASLRSTYRSYFITESQTPRNEYERRKVQAEGDFQKSQEERERIANEAKVVREGCYKPLRSKIEAFVKKCIPEIISP